MTKLDINSSNQYRNKKAFDQQIAGANRTAARSFDDSSSSVVLRSQRIVSDRTYRQNVAQCMCKYMYKKL